MHKKLLAFTLAMALTLNTSVIFAQSSATQPITSYSIVEIIDSYDVLVAKKYHEEKVYIISYTMSEIEKSTNKQQLLEKFAIKAYSTAKENFSLLEADYLWSLISKELTNSTFQREYDAKFKELAKEIVLNMSAGEEVQTTTTTPTNGQNENTGGTQEPNTPQLPEVSKPTQSSNDSEIAYTTVDFEEKNGTYYRVEYFYNWKGSLINTSSKIASKDELFQFGIYQSGEVDFGENTTLGQNPSQGNTSQGQGSEGLLNQAVNENYRDLMKNSSGDIVAIVSDENTFILNKYRLVYTVNKYATYTHYVDNRIHFEGEIVPYGALKEVFKSITVELKGFFVDDDNRFVSIINGALYSFDVDSRLHVSEIDDLFLSFRYGIKGELLEARKYSEEFTNGKVTFIDQHTGSKIYKPVAKRVFEIENVNLSNKTVINKDNTLLFPVKSTAKDLEFKVYENYGSVTFEKGDTVITYSLDDNLIVVNDVRYRTSTKAIRMPDGEIYGVFIPEAFGLDSEYQVSEDGLNTITHFTAK